MTSVTVLADRYADGWPDHENGAKAEVLPLGVALEQDYPTDAHFTAYATPNGRRLNRDAVGLVPVELTCVVFDCDGPNHATTPEWLRDMRARVRQLAEVHPEPYYYETRGGARFVYCQAEPTILRTQEDAQKWRQQYVTGCAYLERRFGIEADPSCGDWQRLYRFPRVKRDGKPQNYPVWGNAAAIGTLTIDATREDVERARQIAPRAFDAPRKAVTANTITPSDGYGVFYYALRSRNDLGTEYRDGFKIRCPREREHTAGRSFDGSTLLYLPGPGEELGCIFCMHAHCQSVTTRQWIACFSDSELEAARAAAGIARTKWAS